MNDITFDRESNSPLYLQLKNHILMRIQHGDWQEGSRIPTEIEMKNEFGLSRATIRQALDELENEGLIERKRRLGTVVSTKRVRPEIMKLTSFSDDMISRGLTPDSKTLNIGFVTPPPKVQSIFNLDATEKIWHISRLRFANGEPFGIHELYIPPTLQFSPRELSTMTSYYELLEKNHGLKPARATENLSASVATKHEAAILNIKEGAPLLVAWRNTYSADDQILESVKILYRADRYEYSIQLIA